MSALQALLHRFRPLIRPTSDCDGKLIWWTVPSFAPMNMLVASGRIVPVSGTAFARKGMDETVLLATSNASTSARLDESTYAFQLSGAISSCVGVKSCPKGTDIVSASVTVGGQVPVEFVGVITSM